MRIFERLPARVHAPPPRKRYEGVLATQSRRIADGAADHVHDQDEERPSRPSQPDRSDA